MMRIGITGKPGSGKTTLSYYLYQLLPNCYFPDMDMLYHNRGYEKMMNGIGWRYVTAGVSIGKNSEEPNKSYEYILKLCKEKGIEIEGDFSLKEKASYALSKLAFKYTKEYLDKDTPKYCDFVILDFYLLPYLSEFCGLDYNVFLDVDSSIRYEHALNRMSENEGKEFSDGEKANRIKKMEEFEKKENVNYHLIDYDSILKNTSNLTELKTHAKNIALYLLQKYSKKEIKEMLVKEFDYYVKKIENASNSFSFKSYAYKELKDSFNDVLTNKLLFLYEENLIDKESFKIVLEKEIYGIKYYLSKTRYIHENTLKEIFPSFKEKIIKFYKNNLIDKETYNKLIKELKCYKKTIR